ncbi:MAG: ATP-dependent sacrificial sulfur transferase LarE [Bacillota bacterium]
MDKIKRLRDWLRDVSGAVVAYSGGVDSTFLAYMSFSVLGERALCVTAVSPTYPEHQLCEARTIAQKMGLRHRIIRTGECESAEFTANTPDRCYHCKLALFTELRRLAQENNLPAVLDGANADDAADHRPGHRAGAELGVKSPLRELGFTKNDIREASRALQLPTWNKPAYACLASRIPYGTPISTAALKRIDEAENFLVSLGLRQIRVRDHHPVARIEVDPAELELAWRDRRKIAAGLHAAGYPYVALDLDGFRSGSMNEVLGKDSGK